MKDIYIRTIMLKGEQGGTITKIEKIGEQGSTDYLRIFLSDGDHVDFEVLNTLDDEHVRGIIAEESPSIIASAVSEAKDYTDSQIVSITTIVNTLYPVGSIKMSTSNVNPATYLGVGTWSLWGSGRVPVGVNTSDSDFDTVEKTGGEKSHVLTTGELAIHTHTYTPTAHTHTIEGLSGGSTSLWGNGRASLVVQGDGSVIRRTPDGDTTIVSSDEGSTASGYYNNIRLGQGTLETLSSSASASIGNAGSGNAHNNLQPYITCYMWKRTA